MLNIKKIMLEMATKERFRKLKEYKEKRNRLFNSIINTFKGGISTIYFYPDDEKEHYRINYIYYYDKKNIKYNSICELEVGVKMLKILKRIGVTLRNDFSNKEVVSLEIGE